MLVVSEKERDGRNYPESEYFEPAGRTSPDSLRTHCFIASKTDTLAYLGEDHRKKVCWREGDTPSQPKPGGLRGPGGVRTVEETTRRVWRC